MLCSKGENWMENRWQTAQVAWGVLLGLGLSFVGMRPVAAQTTTDLPLIVGRASGSGRFAVGPGLSATFNFHLDSRTVGQQIPGQLRLIDQGTGALVISQKFTAAFFGPDLVQAEGLCTINGLPGVFHIEAFDASRPGDFDNFSISYETLFDSSFVGGLVPAGNIRIRIDHLTPAP
jgi:hypothetical protein